MVVRSYSVTCFISLWLSQENWAFVCSAAAQFIMFTNVLRSFSLVGPLRHFIITIVKTTLKALNKEYACHLYFVECVSKVKSILTLILYKMYGVVCCQLTHFSCDDRMDIRTSSHYHNQLGNKIRQPSLMVKSWNNDMCCVINISLSVRCDWTSMPVLKTLLICTP